MLTELCAELRNYFCQKKDKHFGNFTIEGGNIEPLDFLADGQYFRIVGSTMNDGIYQYPAMDLTDETFNGAIWAMSVPPAVLQLAEKIKKFEVNSEASPYTSESLGSYSYTRATGANGLPLTWQEAFRNELKRWRKI